MRNQKNPDFTGFYFNFIRDYSCEEISLEFSSPSFIFILNKNTAAIIHKTSETNIITQAKIPAISVKIAAALLKLNLLFWRSKIIARTNVAIPTNPIIILINIAGPEFAALNPASKLFEPVELSACDSEAIETMVESTTKAAPMMLRIPVTLTRFFMLFSVIIKIPFLFIITYFLRYLQIFIVNVYLIDERIGFRPKFCSSN
ncbi:cation transport ATPase [Lactococcus lactis subsp. lactis]|uniref:Cation transport ATPase n=1 Tax=Lactococcus lactis subsp. lactis TaxID=1360 RepID=A0A0B8QSI5_LACLL|nr:cation transport ATPase [Lactococcus lactis subsp. lactis]